MDSSHVQGEKGGKLAAVGVRHKFPMLGAIPNTFPTLPISPCSTLPLAHSVLAADLPGSAGPSFPCDGLTAIRPFGMTVKLIPLSER